MLDKESQKKDKHRLSSLRGDAQSKQARGLVASSENTPWKKGYREKRLLHVCEERRAGSWEGWGTWGDVRATVEGLWHLRGVIIYSPEA